MNTSCGSYDTIRLSESGTLLERGWTLAQQPSCILPRVGPDDRLTARLNVLTCHGHLPSEYNDRTGSVTPQKCGTLISKPFIRANAIDGSRAFAEMYCTHVVVCTFSHTVARARFHAYLVRARVVPCDGPESRLQARSSLSQKTVMMSMSL